MKKIWKRATAFALATTMLVPCIDIKQALASTQTRQRFETYREGTETLGQWLKLPWEKMKAPTNTDAEDVVIDPDSGVDKNADFRVHGTNAYVDGDSIVFYNTNNASDTVPITEPEFSKFPGPGDKELILMNAIKNRLSANNLYSFKLTPWHYVVDAEGKESVKQPVYASRGEQEFLVMPDLNVTAKAENGKLTVEWDTPGFEGAHAFSDYMIYYREISSNTIEDPRKGSSEDPIQVTMEQGWRAGLRVRKEIADTDIKRGHLYVVAVEPMVPYGFSMKPLREAPAQTNITLGGATYNIAYSPYGKRYGADNIRVKMELTQSPDLTTDSGAWLEWSTLPDIGEVVIVRGTSLSDVESKLNLLASNSPNVNIWASTKNVNSKYYVPYQQSDVYYGVAAKRTINNATVYIPSNGILVSSPTADIKPNVPYIHALQPGDINESNNTVEIFWDAFVRAKHSADKTDADDSENPDVIEMENGEYYDGKTYYDIFVTDQQDLWKSTDTTLPLVAQDVLSKSLPAPVEDHAKGDGTKSPAFAYTIGSFVDASKTMVSTLYPNREYYVRVTAKKKYDNGTDKYAESAYYSFYYKADGDISAPPMIAKLPLQIREKNGMQVITQNSIDIAWKENWYEVFDASRPKGTDPAGYNDPTYLAKRTWQTRAAENASSGWIEYGEDTVDYNPGKLINFSILETPAAVRQALGIDGMSVPVRQQSMDTDSASALKYEMKTVPMADFKRAIDAAGGYDAYLESLFAEGGAQGWATVTPNHPANELTYVTATSSFENGSRTALKPNSPYAILIRAYYDTTPDGVERVGYANFVIATTAAVDSPIIITPTTPIVEALSATSDTASIRWNHSDSYQYEVAYSEIYLKDIESQYTSAQRLTAAQVEALSTVKTVDGKQYRYLEVDRLFPDTEYNFWVRALATSGGTTRYSLWSNPATIHTAPLEKPNAPYGLGIASADDLALINEGSNTNYTPKNKDYLIVEWFKDLADTRTSGAGTSNDVANVLSNENITELYLTQFINLVPNAQYYFRARTVVTVTKGANNATTTSYSYIVQISKDPNFIEAREIHVPSVPALPADESKYRQAESDWTATIHYTTSMSHDDVDTDKNPDMYPLPAEDFEISYDSGTQTLTYRFRTNKKDASGAADNGVDQRFITNLVNKRVHKSNIDVTKYGDNVIHKRVVEVPYSILTAFDERKIDFGVTAGDVTIELKPGALDLPQVQQLSDYGRDAKLQITLDENLEGKPLLGANQAYASVPQTVTMKVVTPTTSVKLEKTATPLGVRVQLQNRADTLDSNVQAYYFNDQTTQWTSAPATYQKETGQLLFTAQPAAYAAIASQAPSISNLNDGAVSMLNVHSALNITDMTSFDSNAKATGNQVINVLYALANGTRDVAINKIPDAAEITALQNAGMGITANAATVPREQAISAMVRLYELKTKQQIKPTYTVATSPYSGTSSASPTYQTAMLKAAEVDLLNGPQALRPKETISIGELFGLADAIIADAGM